MLNIEELRKQIDEIDAKVVELLNRRAELSLQVKKLKLANNLPVYDKDREEKIHRLIKEKNKGLLREQDLERIYRLLLEVMRGIDAP